MMVCFISALLDENQSDYVQCFGKKGKHISGEDYK
jgi:hypothetical protein